MKIALIYTVFIIFFCKNLSSQVSDARFDKFIAVNEWTGTISVKVSWTRDRIGTAVINGTVSMLKSGNGGLNLIWGFDAMNPGMRNWDVVYTTSYTDGDCSYSRSGEHSKFSAALYINPLNFTYSFAFLDPPIPVDYNCPDDEKGITNTDVVYGLEVRHLKLELDTLLLMGSLNFTDADAQQKDREISEGYRDTMINRLNRNIGILDSFNVQIPTVEEPENNTTDETGAVSYEVTWELVPKRENPIVTLDPVNEEWLPENNSLVTTKVKWDERSTATNLRFTLYDISTEPGICMNDTKDDRTIDLCFDSAWTTENHYEIVILTDEEMIVERRGLELSNEQTIVIKCFDYGAYGKLKAEVMIDGVWVTALEKNAYDKDYTRIPFDENMNNIADKWEKDVGVFSMNLPPRWDEDPEPAEQRRNGDGYVLYEEYRGFNAYDHILKKPDNVQIDDMHFRSDPMFKDVFVFAEGFSFKSMYSSNPANLNCHIITREDMVYNSVDAVTHRWVNNKTSYTFYYAKQYAINVRVLTEIPNWEDSKNSWGLTYTVNGIFDELDDKMIEVCQSSSPIKCKPVCFILMDNIYSLLTRFFVSSNTNEIIMKSAERTLIHEIGHNLGITHHGGRDTTLINEHPDCSMRYVKNGEYNSASEYEMHLALENSYCKGGMFNCYGQIDVKSDP